jgi:hypothetical protein
MNRPFDDALDLEAVIREVIAELEARARRRRPGEDPIWWPAIEIAERFGIRRHGSKDSRKRGVRLLMSQLAQRRSDLVPAFMVTRWPRTPATWPNTGGSGIAWAWPTWRPSRPAAAAKPRPTPTASSGCLHDHSRRVRRRWVVWKLLPLLRSIFRICAVGIPQINAPCVVAFQHLGVVGADEKLLIAFDAQMRGFAAAG